MATKALLVFCLATSAGAACTENHIQMALIETAGVKTHSSLACIFPFTYKGAEYTECAWSAMGDWCPYEVDTNGGYIESKYGYCQFSGGGNGCVEILLGAEGENTCGAKNSQIVTEAACKAAAKSLESGSAGGLDLTWKGPVDEASVAKSPNGCYHSSTPSKEGVYFNTNRAANAPVYFNDTQQICLKGPCTTAGGKSCEFPFTYKGGQYSKCILSDATADTWCPTAGYAAGNDKWDYCLAACPSTHHCEVGENSKCRECVPESERTGNSQCKSCNAGYKLQPDKTCERVCGDELSLSGAKVKNVKGAMGTYKITPARQAGRHIYEFTKKLNNKKLYLYWFPTDALQGNWMVGPHTTQNIGLVKSEMLLLASSCPEDTPNWHCFDGARWSTCSARVTVLKHAQGAAGISGACGTFARKGSLLWILLAISSWRFGA